MAPWEPNLSKLSSLLELNNFVNQVFRGLAFDTANNPENTEMAKWEALNTLLRRQKKTSLDSAYNCCPLISSFQDFYQLSFNRKKERKKKALSPFNLLIERERKGFVFSFLVFFLVGP